MEMEKETGRIPTGIMVIGIYHKWWAGCATFFGAGGVLVAMLFPNFLAIFASSLEKQGWSVPSYRMFLMVSLLFSPLCFILGDGVLHLKEWSRKRMVYLNILALLIFPFFTIQAALAIGQNLIFSGAFGVILYGLIIYYLTRPTVKERFK